MAIHGEDPWARTPRDERRPRRARPASARSADFGIDTTAKSTGEAIRGYFTNLRNGELGSLPALLGLLALFILFTVLASDTFPSLLNLANLLQQGAGQTIIAMGLVFVLLTGEIDLAAGTASGLTAAVMALHLVSDGQPARLDGHHGVHPVRGGVALARSCWPSSCGSGRARRSRRWPWSCW